MPSVIIPPDDVSPSTGTGNQVRSNSPTIVTPSVTGKLQTEASSVSSAGLNLPQGTAPTAPVNGDLWITSGGLYAQVAGATVGPFSTGGTTFANPTASVGLTAVNGTASTAMRSDAAPAIDQTIVPTWTGIHTWSLAAAVNTTSDGLVLVNPTTSGLSAYNNSNSPRLRFRGQAYKTNGSVVVPVDSYLALEPQLDYGGGGGGNVYASLYGRYSLNGAAYVTYLAIKLPGWEYGGVGIGTTNAATVGDGSIAIGAGSNATGLAGVAIGFKATTGNNSGSTAIGANINVNGGRAIGISTSISGNCTIAADSIGLGGDQFGQALTTASGQFVAACHGGTTNVFFGNGVTNSAPVSYTINGTGGSGTNIVSANVSIAAGRSTGNAAPASVLIRTTSATTSGTTAQTLGTIGTFTTNSLTITPVTQIAANTSSDGLILENSLSATAGNQSYSPRLKLLGRIWSGSASQTAAVTTEVKNSASGANDLLYLTNYAVAGGTEYSLISIAGRTATVEDAAIGIGPQTTQNGWAGVSVGGKASTGEKCVSVGGLATSVNESVAIGYLSNVGSGPSIAIGSRSTTTGAYQFVAGSGNNPIYGVYFGKGVTNSSAVTYAVNGTGGSGTNNAGGDLQLCGGLSTGNATPGAVVLRAGTVGSSGSTAQTATTVATFTTTGVTVATSLSDSIGNVRSIPQNAQTSAYILAATDNGKHISITTGGVTVNASTLTTGQVAVIFNNSGSAQTITQGASVTMYLGGSGTTGNRTLAGYGVATILCVGTDTYVITGSGLT